MGAYILRRLALMIPTIFGIMAISFAVIQFAPGGPVEQVIADLTGQGGGATDRIGGGSDTFASDQFASEGGSSQYRGAQGLDPANSSPGSKRSSASTSRRSSASSMMLGLYALRFRRRAISAMSP
jgi:ABC-type microcin C transport system permease subunit YejB